MFAFFEAEIMISYMKLIKYIPFLAFVSLLIGCATTFRPWKLSEVKEGMTRGAVVEILGEPDSTDTEDGMELLYYSYSEGFNAASADNEIRFNETTDLLKEKALEDGLKEYHYVVKLTDGKVLDYKEVEEQD